MNDNYYNRIPNKQNIYNQNHEDYSDNNNFNVDDDDFTDETITSDDIRMIGSKPSNSGKNFQKQNPYSQDQKTSDAPSSKYDVNNPSYRISGGFNSINKQTSNFSDVNSNNMYGSGFNSMGTTNKAYDPYSNININNNYSSAGFKSEKDKYNIDIDINKYDKGKDKKAKNAMATASNSAGFPTNSKEKNTNFNYNYNLNNYGSNLNYAAPFKKEEINYNNQNEDPYNNNKPTEKKEKKKKKDFFDDLDNQLKKDKLNDENENDYDDEFGIQLQNRDNDHINIKSGEDDSEDLKEITNINKELESISNSKDLNEVSLRNKKSFSKKGTKYTNEKVYEEEFPPSEESSTNENLVKFTQLTKDKNKFINETETDNLNSEAFGQNYENDYDNDLNSYRQTEESIKKDISSQIKSNLYLQNETKKSANLDTNGNEDIRDSTISIGDYMDDESKSKNKTKDKNNENNKNEDFSQDISSDMNYQSQSQSKKLEEYDYDKFTLSQNSHSANKNKDIKGKFNNNNNNEVYDTNKMEEYLKKSKANNFYNNENNNNNISKSEKSLDPKNLSSKDNNNNNLANKESKANLLGISKDSKAKNLTDRSSYNYSQDGFISQEKPKDEESEFNNYDDFDSNIESLQDTSPQKMPSYSKESLILNKKDREKSNSNFTGLYTSEDLSKEENLISQKENFNNKKESEKEKNYSAKKISEEINSVSINKNNKSDYVYDKDKDFNFNENANLKINNKTIEEKSDERSSDIIDTKENERYINYKDNMHIVNTNKASDNNNNNFNSSNNENLIKEIIAKEMSKYINTSPTDFNNLNNNNSSYGNTNKMTFGPNNSMKQNHDNDNNLQIAKAEILTKTCRIEKSNNFFLQDDYEKSKIPKKATKFFKLNSKKDIEITIYGNGLSRKDIRELKLDSALNEERKKREFFEFNFNRQKELISDQEAKIRQLKQVEIDNSELKKLNIELENRYGELEKDLKNMKADCDYKMKLIEERVSNRELKNETRRLLDLQTKFDIEIENMKLSLKDKENEIVYYKEKSELVEKENNKLNTNKLTNIETNEKVRELQNENFILHEKCNTIKNDFDKLEKENNNLKGKIENLQLENFNKQILIEEKGNVNVNKNESENSILKSDKFIKSDSMNIYQQQLSNFNKGNVNIFEQIYLERDSNTQNVLSQCYLKEIQNLQSEIKLIKNINNVNKYNNNGLNFNPVNNISDNYNENEESNQYQQNENFYSDENENEEYNNNNTEIMENSQTKNDKNNESLKKNSLNNNSNSKKKNLTQKNNYLKNSNNSNKIKSNNNTNTSLFRETNNNNSFKKNNLGKNSILKKCAEEKIKKLKHILINITSPNGENGIKLLSEEIKIFDKNSTGDLELENFLKILLQILNIDMGKYELIEVFNNFYKSGANKIKSADLLNALSNNEPSVFFIQSDPGYLMQIEKKILENQKLINEKQNLIGDLNTKIVKYQEKFVKLENLNKEYKEKIDTLEKEKNANSLVFNELVKNSVLKNSGVKDYNSNDNFNNHSKVSSSGNNKDINLLKEKIKNLEESHQLTLKDFEIKISTYENKMKDIKDIFENNSKEELFKLKENNEILQKENNQRVLKIKELEQDKKNKFEKFDEKIRKLKKLNLLETEKSAKLQTEKDKLISLLNKKNINTNFINNYLSAEEIESLEKKISDMERRNKDREEHYKMLCNTANTQQVNKEIENVTKKFDFERKELLRQLSLKTNELISFKKEFEILMEELEEIKIGQRRK